MEIDSVKYKVSGLGDILYSVQGFLQGGVEVQHFQFGTSELDSLFTGPSLFLHLPHLWPD